MAVHVAPLAGLLGLVSLTALPGGVFGTGGAATSGKWIQGAIKHPGALHRALNVPQGEKIPAKKLAAATHSENPVLRKRAALANTLKGLHKG